MRIKVSPNGNGPIVFTAISATAIVEGISFTGRDANVRNYICTQQEAFDIIDQLLSEGYVDIGTRSTYETPAVRAV